MNQNEFVQVFQDDDLKDLNQIDQEHNIVSNGNTKQNTSLGERRYIHNETSFATKSSFNNTKFDPMSSSDNIDHHGHPFRSPATEFGFMPDTPLTTDTFHLNNYSRPQMQRQHTSNSIEMYANLPQANTSESINTLNRNVSTIYSHCGVDMGMSDSIGANERQGRKFCLSRLLYLDLNLIHSLDKDQSTQRCLKSWRASNGLQIES